MPVLILMEEANRSHINSPSDTEVFPPYAVRSCNSKN